MLHRSGARRRGAAMVLSMLLSGCGLGGPAHQAALPDAAAVVDLGFASFSPMVVNIRAGQTVEWRNNSIITHSVTNDPNLAASAGDAASPPGVAPFVSGDISAGNIYVHTFEAPGTYKYLCTHHEGDGMVGTVIVAP